MNWYDQKLIRFRRRKELPVRVGGHCVYDLTEMEEYAGGPALILQCDKSTELTLVGRPEQTVRYLTLRMNGACTLHLQDIRIENNTAPVLHLLGRSNRIRFCGSNRLCTPPAIATVLAEEDSDFSIAPEDGDVQGSMTITGGILRCGDGA